MLNDIGGATKNGFLNQRNVRNRILDQANRRADEAAERLKRVKLN